MADISITAANVVAGSPASVANGTAGAAVAAGQWVYKDPTTGKFLLADCNSATAAARVADGVALNGAALNQPLQIQKGGLCTIGGTMTAGVAYYLSGTPGGLRPVADNTTGDYPCILGIAVSTTVLDININPAGIAL